MNLKTRISLSYALTAVLILSACNCLSACAQLKQGSESQILPGPTATMSTINPPKPASVDDANVPKEPIGTKVGDILLVYPRGENNNKIDAPATFLVGTVNFIWVIRKSKLMPMATLPTS